MINSSTVLPEPHGFVSEDNKKDTYASMTWSIIIVCHKFPAVNAYKILISPKIESHEYK